MSSVLPLSPLQRYLSDLDKEGFAKDRAQQMAVDKLQMLYEHLIADQLTRKKQASRWFNKFSAQKPKTISISPSKCKIPEYLGLV